MEPCVGITSQNCCKNSEIQVKFNNFVVVCPICGVFHPAEYLNDKPGYAEEGGIKGGDINISFLCKGSPFFIYQKHKGQNDAPDQVDQGNCHLRERIESHEIVYVYLAMGVVSVEIVRSGESENSLAIRYFLKKHK